MFFYVAKVVWSVTVPSTFLCLLTLLGLALIAGRRWRRTGLGLASLAAVLLLGIGLGPAGSWLLLPLEERFPQYRDAGPVAGIITLGGGIQTEISGARGQLSLSEGNERLIALADLGRRYPDARLVYAGGSGALVFEDLSEAETVRRFGGVLGIDTARIRYDDTSRTTWENAVNAGPLIAQKPGERWLLVTSARHMPRSVGCFRAVGIDVTAYPVDYQTRGPQDLWSSEPTVVYGLGRFDGAIREWVGLLAYWLTGRSSALFPAP